MTKRFGKYVSKHLKSLGNEKELIVMGYNVRLSVQISSVIPPTTEWGSFRINVKVIKSEYNMPRRNEDGMVLRDQNRVIIREWKDRTVPRKDVNALNCNIRSRTQQHLGEYLEIFGFRRWDLKVEKVAHLR